MIFFFIWSKFLEHTVCFHNFEYYLKIKKLLYPNEEPIEFYKILRSEYKITKENEFVEEHFPILYGIFSSSKRFLRRNVCQKYEAINIP